MKKKREKKEKKKEKKKKRLRFVVSNGASAVWFSKKAD
jgi:hypothetical protein